jgi:hypothetical protein
MPTIPWQFIFYCGCIFFDLKINQVPEYILCEKLNSDAGSKPAQD